MKKYLVGTLIFISLSGCKFQTPPEMVFGKWYIDQIAENGHIVTADYVDVNTRYLTFTETGVYRVGLLDSSAHKNWMISPSENKLLFLDESPFNNIKKWQIKASDEHIELVDAYGHFFIRLKRILSLPDVTITGEAALMGNWVVDKVTINGYDNTKEYAHPDRWIKIANNGRFYNGSNTNDQNTGFWEINDSYTKIGFFSDQQQEEPFINFNISDDKIWYEKQQDNPSKPKVRIYFKKAADDSL